MEKEGGGGLTTALTCADGEAGLERSGDSVVVRARVWGVEKRELAFGGGRTARERKREVGVGYPSGGGRVGEEE